MKSPIRQCSLLLVAFSVWAEPALARNYLNCVSKKVVIVDAPSGSSSLSAEENIGFWIDVTDEIERGNAVVITSDGFKRERRRVSGGSESIIDPELADGDSLPDVHPRNLDGKTSKRSGAGCHPQSSSTGTREAFVPPGCP